MEPLGVQGKFGEPASLADHESCPRRYFFHWQMDREPRLVSHVGPLGLGRTTRPKQHGRVVEPVIGLVFFHVCHGMFPKMFGVRTQCQDQLAVTDVYREESSISTCINLITKGLCAKHQPSVKAVPDLLNHFCRK
jgi:hypothetical protein